MRVLHPFIPLSFTFRREFVLRLSLADGFLMADALCITSVINTPSSLSLSLTVSPLNGRERNTEQHRTPEPVVEWLILAARAPPYISARLGHVIRRSPRDPRAPTVHKHAPRPLRRLSVYSGRRVVVHARRTGELVEVKERLRRDIGHIPHTHARTHVMYTHPYFARCTRASYTHAT